MAPISLRTQARRHWLLLCILGCVAFGEILSPWFSLYSWPYLATGPNVNETRLLLVADPHLEGYHPSWYWFNYLCQWDSDRYLSMFFNTALERLKPSGFLILGDLFDRGSEATDVEFRQCCHRFHRVFLSDNQIPYLLVPGDNDIDLMEGGPTSGPSVDRFIQCLGSPEGPKQINFVQVRTLSRGSYKVPKSEQLSAPGARIEKLLVVFATHESVSPIHYTDQEINEVLASHLPVLFVSGHHHRAYITRRKFSRDRQSVTEWILSPDGSDSRTVHFRFNLTSCPVNPMSDDRAGRCDLIGLGIPSCTYRSGYPSHEGYGLLRIYANQTASYIGLQLPARTYTLYLYLTCLSICLTHWTVRGFSRIYRIKTYRFTAPKLTVQP